MEEKIKSRTIVIRDQGIINEIIDKEIEHLKLEVCEEDMCIIAKCPDYKNELTISKKYMKVHYGKSSVSIRTPRFLSKYIGKSLEIYKESDSSDELEIFRARPIDFDIISTEKKGRPPKADLPYFLKSGFFAIPKGYIKKHLKNNTSRARVSFSRTDAGLLEKGYLFAVVTYRPRSGEASFPLYKYSNGLRTRQLTRFEKIVEYNNKKLINFKYEATIRDNENDYDVMVFKEIDQNES